MSIDNEHLFTLQRIDGGRWCVKHEGFVDCDQDVCDVARLDQLANCEIWPLYVHRPEVSVDAVARRLRLACSTCNDSGWDAAHRARRPTLHSDYIDCPIHGDVGADTRHGRCLDCLDGR